MEQQVIDLLKEKGPMKQGEIAEAIGVDKGELSKIIKKLTSEGRIVSPKRCYYSII